MASTLEIFTFIVSALSIVVLPMVFIWRLLKMKIFVWKVLLCSTDMAYFILSFGVLLTMASGSDHTTLICKTAGFFTLFGFQDSVWMVLFTDLSFLWIASPLQSDRKTQSNHRRNVLLLIIIIQKLATFVFSVLPLTNMVYFESDVTLKIKCFPLRGLGQRASSYSLFLVSVISSEIFVATVCLLVTLIKLHRARLVRVHSTTDLRTPNKNVTYAILVLRLSVVDHLVLSVVCLLTILVIYSGNSSAQETALFSLTLSSLAHSIISAIGNSFLNGKSFCKRPKPSKPVNATDTGRSLKKLSYIGSQHGVIMLKCSWMDNERRELEEGLLKVYNPDKLKLWAHEIVVHGMLRTRTHSGLLKCQWTEIENTYSDAMTLVTGEEIMSSSRLICVDLMNLGSFQSLFNQLRMPLRGSVLMSLFADIAHALSHLHSLSICHNRLSSKTIFIRGTLETQSLTACIGNYEHSEVVYPDHHLRQSDVFHSHNIVDAIDPGIINAGLFTIDIQSFGLLILEILTSNDLLKLTLQTPPSSKSNIASCQLPTTEEENICAQRQTSFQNLPDLVHVGRELDYCSENVISSTRKNTSTRLSKPPKETQPQGFSHGNPMVNNPDVPERTARSIIDQTEDESNTQIKGNTNSSQECGNSFISELLMRCPNNRLAPEDVSANTTLKRTRSNVPPVNNSVEPKPDEIISENQSTDLLKRICEDSVAMLAERIGKKAKMSRLSKGVGDNGHSKRQSLETSDRIITHGFNATISQIQISDELTTMGSEDENKMKYSWQTNWPQQTQVDLEKNFCKDTFVQNKANLTSNPKIDASKDKLSTHEFRQPNEDKGEFEREIEKKLPSDMSAKEYHLKQNTLKMNKARRQLRAAVKSRTGSRLIKTHALEIQRHGKKGKLQGTKIASGSENQTLRYPYNIPNRNVDLNKGYTDLPNISSDLSGLSDSTISRRDHPKQPGVNDGQSRPFSSYNSYHGHKGSIVDQIPGATDESQMNHDSTCIYQSDKGLHNYTLDGALLKTEESELDSKLGLHHHVYPYPDVLTSFSHSCSAGEEEETITDIPNDSQNVANVIFEPSDIKDNLRRELNKSRYLLYKNGQSPSSLVCGMEQKTGSAGCSVSRNVSGQMISGGICKKSGHSLSESFQWEDLHSLNTSGVSQSHRLDGSTSESNRHVSKLNSRLTFTDTLKTPDIQPPISYCDQTFGKHKTGNKRDRYNSVWVDSDILIARRVQNNIDSTGRLTYEKDSQHFLKRKSSTPNVNPFAPPVTNLNTNIQLSSFLIKRCKRLSEIHQGISFNDLCSMNEEGTNKVRENFVTSRLTTLEVKLFEVFEMCWLSSASLPNAHQLARFLQDTTTQEQLNGYR